MVRWKSIVANMFYTAITQEEQPGCECDRDPAESGLALPPEHHPPGGGGQASRQHSLVSDV